MGVANSTAIRRWHRKASSACKEGIAGSEETVISHLLTPRRAMTCGHSVRC